jgi:hypothetical protein
MEPELSGQRTVLNGFIRHFFVVSRHLNCGWGIEIRLNLL